MLCSTQPLNHAGTTAGVPSWVGTVLPGADRSWEGHDTYVDVARCQTPRFRRSPPKHTQSRRTHVTQKVAGVHPSQQQQD